MRIIDNITAPHNNTLILITKSQVEVIYLEARTKVYFLNSSGLKLLITTVNIINYEIVHEQQGIMCNNMI